MLTDDKTHVAVHLQDFYPEIYGDNHPKEFKDKATELYQKLTLELYKDKLLAFVKRIKN